MGVSMDIRIKCVSCGKTFTLEVEKENWEKYTRGSMLQDALPELTADERELIINQLCGTCFNKITK